MVTDPHTPLPSGRAGDFTPPRCSRCHRPGTFYRRNLIDGRFSVLLWCDSCDCAAIPGRPFYPLDSVDRPEDLPVKVEWSSSLDHGRQASLFGGCR